MSASLHWKHAPKPPANPKDSCLSHDLMFILRDRYWRLGALSGEVRLTLKSDGSYFQGLADAKVEDANTVLELLRDNPEGIIIYHSF